MRDTAATSAQPAMIVMSIWCSSLSLSSRSLAIALVICVTLVYFSYSFNACLLASISRSLQQVNMSTNHWTMSKCRG